MDSETTHWSAVTFWQVNDVNDIWWHKRDLHNIEQVHTKQEIKTKGPDIKQAAFESMNLIVFSFGVLEGHLNTKLIQK